MYTLHLNQAPSTQAPPHVEAFAHQACLLKCINSMLLEVTQLAIYKTLIAV